MRYLLSEDLPEARYGDFLEAVCRDAGLSEPAVSLPAEGVGDRAGEVFPTAFAVSAAQRFAAFRYTRSACGSQEAGPVLLDAFFMRLANGRCRAGSIAYGGGPAAGWPEQLALELRPAGKPLPGFTELAALLSAAGDIEISSAEMTGELAQARLDADYFQTLGQELAEEVRQLKSKLRSAPAGLRVGLGTENGTASEDAASAPLGFEDLPGWCLQNESRLVVLPRALGACKKAHYEDPPAAFAGLEFLAGPFRENRMGRLGLEAMEQALLATGLRVAGSVAPNIAGEQGEAYFVNWRGRRRFLEWHLLKGGGREERYCLRIYYFWCEETQRAVVGWLPSHLGNSLS